MRPNSLPSVGAVACTLLGLQACGTSTGPIGTAPGGNSDASAGAAPDGPSLDTSSSSPFDASTGTAADATAPSVDAPGAAGDSSSVAADAQQGSAGGPGTDAGPDSALAAQRIQHVIVVMQENRSFDHYFGTFPGADGIPMNATGQPTVCVPDPKTNTCVKPFRLTADKNFGGPHSSQAFLTCVHGGLMDGFIRNAETGKTGCADPNDPVCSAGTLVDVMGYHTDAEIPNYWAYAKNFALQDHMFQQNASWSYPGHIFMVSAWSATCTQDDPMTCTTNINTCGTTGVAGPGNHYPWTDLTYLLHKAGVSWKYYLGQGMDPHCGGDPTECQPIPLDPAVPSIWNPLPDFDDVNDDQQAGNVVTFDQFYQDVHAGTLPAVSWIAPASNVSEHPAALVSTGQAYVTALINTVMQSPFWSSTAIFVSWDDWGGFYDHVIPPVVDKAGYGIRVPGLTVSPWVKKAGLIDKQVLSHDAYIKFIEDVFLGGQRLDPATDGRPDSRPGVRETNKQLGDLMTEFDFTRTPLPPLVLKVQ